MKDSFKCAYMNCALEFAELSHAKRAKVGAILVKDNRIISIGINGMPSGWSNECETNVVVPEVEVSPGIIDIVDHSRTVTKPEVSHAERNCLDKMAKSTESSAGSIMFVTHEPCFECAKSIHNCGVVSVYYRKKHESQSHGSGIEFLEKAGVTVKRL